MFRYRIAVPANHADEIENVLMGEAEVHIEGTVPAPEEIADEAWAVQSDGFLSIISVEGSTLQSISSLKNWLEQRFADPYVDIRLQGPSGGFDFSFQAHSAEEIKDWLRSRAPRESAPRRGGGRSSS